MKVGKALNEYEIGKYICMITISVDQLLMFFIVVKFWMLTKLAISKKSNAN